MKRPGKAWLIGAGPGDPELLTLKAVRALGECDVLFVDDLANPAVLAHARPDARRIAVGKRARCRSTPQEFIERSMIRYARAGAIVGRVKGGDPFVFGRGGEEVLALRGAGIDVEIVSGITAGCAVPAAIGIPVTHREVSRSVTFVTAHTRDGGGPDYAALARVGGTLVFYMGLNAVEAIAEGLVAGGLSPDTPACAIANGTLPTQVSVVTTLDRLPIDARALAAPALIVVGEVVKLGQIKGSDSFIAQAAAIKESDPFILPARPSEVRVKPRLVVVGHGMAAARTLEHLMTIAPGRHDVTVIGAEPVPGYNRILLSPVLAGEMTKEELTLHGAEWYARHGIRLKLGRKATAILRGPREIVTDDGVRTPYDTLLLATGSRPMKLPVPGADLEGVATYRDLADTEAMIRASEVYPRAVVIGGGLLGLEAASGLRTRGMEVDVVHVMPWVMERQLDESAAAVVQRKLEARGIRFHLGYQTVSIEGDRSARSVTIQRAGADPVQLPADLVVMAVGIRPDTALAGAAGLRVDRGIVVDDTLLTYDPRIYAVGECVRHRGTCYGLVQPLYEMAKVCATHLAGVGSHYYSGSTQSTHLKVTGIDVFSAGDLSEAPRRQSQVLRDPVNGIYRRLILEDDRLVGGVLVGDSTGAARYADLIRTKASIAPLRKELMFLR